VANELLLGRSYLGLNFQELADLVGVRKASLYHHFPSKPALALATVKKTQERFLERTLDHSDQPPAQQLIAYVGRFRETLAREDRVCAIGATAPEWGEVDPELQQAVKDFHDAQLRWLGAQVRRAGSAHGAAAKSWAAFINSTCQGALLNARVHSSIAAFEQAVAPLLRLLSAA
jgi:TetR/AcrR family transcriptional repressor of nem operon